MKTTLQMAAAIVLVPRCQWDCVQNGMELKSYLVRNMNTNVMDNRRDRDTRTFETIQAGMAIKATSLTMLKTS